MFRGSWQMGDLASLADDETDGDNIFKEDDNDRAGDGDDDDLNQVVRDRRRMTLPVWVDSANKPAIHLLLLLGGAAPDRGMTKVFATLNLSSTYCKLSLSQHIMSFRTNFSFSLTP